jgi:elongation factor Ts
LTGFVRFQLGEGIEKQAGDFAAEVAAAAGVPQPPPPPAAPPV